MTDKQLRAIADRTHSASPPPWLWWDISPGGGGGTCESEHVGNSVASGRSVGLGSIETCLDEHAVFAWSEQGLGFAHKGPSPEDAVFLANARQDCADLLAYAEFLSNLVSDLREDSTAYRLGKSESAGLPRTGSFGEMSESAVCQRCGGRDFQIAWQRFKNGTRHVRATCSQCGGFLRFLPRGE